MIRKLLEFAAALALRQFSPIFRQPSSPLVALPFPLSSMGDMSLAVSFALPRFDSVNVLHDSSKEGWIVLFLGGF